MNRPIENRERRDPMDTCQIDRLVDGELSDTERRALLLRLESEPDGWRRCALAFLEAQCLRETFAAPAICEVRPVATPRDARPSYSRRWRHAASLSALAASIVAAFAAGWALRQKPLDDVQHAPIATSVGSETKETALTPEHAPAEVAANPPQPPELVVNDPIVKRWEELGFRAQRQKRLVSVELNDGRKVELPVNEIQLEYVGSRTY